MQFVGKAARTEVDFLFDSCASTNYVSSAFTRMHGLTVKPSDTNVRLGTGDSVPAQGKCFHRNFSFLPPVCRRGPRPGLSPLDALPEVPPPSRTPLFGYPVVAHAAGHPCPGALASLRRPWPG
jgi:hypothetical protein